MNIPIEIIKNVLNPTTFYSQKANCFRNSLLVPTPIRSTALLRSVVIKSSEPVKRLNLKTIPTICGGNSRGTLYKALIVASPADSAKKSDIARTISPGHGANSPKK